MKDSFFRWLLSGSNRNIKLFYATAIAITGAIALITPLEHFREKLIDIIGQMNPMELLNSNLYLHCFLLFVIVLSVKKLRIRETYLKQNLLVVKDKFGFTTEDQVDIAVDRAISSEIEFKKYWLWFWISLLGLYGSWLFTEIKMVSFSDGMLTENVKNISTVFFNNLGSLFLFLCYTILSHPTYKKTDNNSARVEINSVPYILSTVILTIAHIYFVSNGNVEACKIANGIFTGISGILFAVTLSLVIGSLDSKFMASPTILVVLLYCYSAIQPFILMFDLSVSIHVTILYLGLLLKIVFFLFVFWLSETKRLLFYFLEVSQLYKFVNDNWEEIKEHLDNEKLP